MRSNLILLFLLISTAANAQTSPVKTTYETVSTNNISVTYGRPQKNDCKIFGNLHKFGNVWNAGAEKATTITFTSNVSFGGENVNAGTYALFVIPNETQWTIILNTQTEQWGTYTYEKYKDNNIVTINVPVTTLTNTVEQLTIRFPQSTSMIIEWDKTQVTIPVL
jgi:hypothetical protein